MQTDCALQEFRVVYQDEHLLAVHKPAGLLVHRSPIDKRETRFALQMARDLAGQYVYPVHRLDKATSGLLLFGLDQHSASLLGEQWRLGKVQKTYWALVRGWSPESGLIDRALRYKADPYGDPMTQAAKARQPAVTVYRRLATASLEKPLGAFPSQRYSLVQLSPQSGRKHQLRRHLNHISHPIIGDVNYGDRHHNHLFNDWRGYHRLYLAARELRFLHPVSAQAMKLSCPLQADFERTLCALGLMPTVQSAAGARSSTDDLVPRSQMSPV